MIRGTCLIQKTWKRYGSVTRLQWPPLWMATSSTMQLRSCRAQRYRTARAPRAFKAAARILDLLTRKGSLLWTQHQPNSMVFTLSTRTTKKTSGSQRCRIRHSKTKRKEKKGGRSTIVRTHTYPYGTAALSLLLYAIEINTRVYIYS